MLRAARLLIRLRLRRMLNMLRSRRRWRSRPKASGDAWARKLAGTRPGARAGRSPRRGEGGKRGGDVLAVIFGLMMALWATTLSATLIDQVHATTGVPSARTPGEIRDDLVAAERAGETERVQELAREFATVHVVGDMPRPHPHLNAEGRGRVSLILAVLLVASLLMSIGARELATPEWDMEWLVTLPIPLRSLLAVRILERSLLNPWGVLLIWPFVSVLAYKEGAGGWAPLVGLAGAAPWLIVIGALRTLADTGLRMVLSPARLRNLQAVLSILGIVSFYAVLSLANPEPSALLAWLPAGAAVPAWMPTSITVAAFAGPGAVASAGALGLGVLQALAMAGACYALMRRWLRAGVVAGGGRESARGASRKARTTARPTRRRGLLALLTPVQVRELRLLGRDRSFLVQSMVLPVVIIGAQFLIHPARFGELGAAPNHLSAVAFGMAAYALMFSAFQTLNAEGAALWVLYTLPCPLQSVLRQKAALWSVLTLLYPVAILGAGVAFGGGRVDAEALAFFAVVLVGVPIYAAIAAALGVFACDPLAQDVRRKVRPAHTYLFMLVAGLYTYAIYARSWWERVAVMTLTALLSLALWQKARDRLPYLLDPTEAPRSRVSVADGLIAALIFFVVQGLAAALMLGGKAPGDMRGLGAVLLGAYVIGGAVAVVSMGTYFASKRSVGVPVVLGAGRGRAALTGLAVGLVAAAFAVGYLVLIKTTGWFAEELKAQNAFGSASLVWICVLAVVCAPLFEEYIFRGLIFGGLRRSWSWHRAALASAAVFAVVHPPISIVPVFVLGLCAAFAHERSGALLAPVIVHATYNGAMMALVAGGAF